MSSFTSNFSARGLRLLAVCLCGGTFVAWWLLHAVFALPNWKSMAVADLGKGQHVLFLGSSRVFFGVDPRPFEGKAINLACDYMDGSTMRRLWDSYRERLDSVQVVVLEGGLAPYYYDTRTLAPDSLRDFGLSVFPENPLLDPAAAIRSALWPFFRWRLSPRDYERYERSRENPDDALYEVAGFVPSRLELTFAEEFAAREIAKAERLRNETPQWAVDANRRAFESLISDLIQAGKRVVWLRFPVHAAVWPQYPSAWTEEVEAEKQRLASKFPQLEIWDLWQDPPFAAAEFRDPDHLNAKGAHKMSLWLKERLFVNIPL